MKTILPTSRTRRPDRRGLSYFEIYADGLIHTAAVFGFESDDRYVERLAVLGWANGVELVKQNHRKAAEVSQLLGESLEVGRSEALTLCQDLNVQITGVDDAFAAARSFYRQKYNTPGLNIEDTDAAGRIRHIIGEATLGGLLSRGGAPELYRAMADQTAACRNEQAFLTTRALHWARKSGLPIDHPLLELAAWFYPPSHPREAELLCTAIAGHLPKVLEKQVPWALELWLMPAWKEGVMTAKFAPDHVALAVGELSEDERSFNMNIFDKCIIGTQTPDERVNLPDAFAQYLAEWNPCGLGHEEIRDANPRMVAARAFDFAMWMGMIAELPVSLGGKRSDR